MENIREILTRLGIECDVEQVEKAVLENYRTVAEVEGIKSKSKTLEDDAKAKDDHIAALMADIDNLKAGTEEVDALKGQIDEYRKSEIEAKAKAEADAAKQQFEKSFDAALKDRKFSNDFTRRAVMDDVRKMRETDSVSGLEVLIEQATKDVPDVWHNPNRPTPQTVPGAMPGAVDGLNLEKIKAMSTKEINENWEAVAAVISQ